MPEFPTFKWDSFVGYGHPDGTEQHAMTMITVNGDEHPIMKRMHRLGDEKRSVVILRPDDWEEWLMTSNVEAARAMLQLYPPEEMIATADPSVVSRIW
ncbi:DUF159 family protein [Burkholderia cenocepacia]|nr:DUF159 family protein [Burkholderia cenocepacia]